MKKLLSLLFVCLFLFGSVRAEQTVFRVGEHEPFPPGTPTCDVYICPLIAADSFIITCGGESMIIDMGTNTQEKKIRRVIDALGIKHFNIAFNTHPHDDHLGSMIGLLADYTFDRFLTPYGEKYDRMEWYQKRTRKALMQKGVPIELVDNGDTFTLGGAEFRVIRQSKKEKTLNYSSAMLMMQFGERRMLFCADVIDIAQYAILEMGADLKADVMKYPHHGITPCKKPFLEAISPEYIIFTHGWVNTKRTQAQAERSNIRYDLGTWGTIHLSTDGSIFLVDQELNDTGLEMIKRHPHK